MHDIGLWAYTLPHSSLTSCDSNFNNNETGAGARSTRKGTKPDFGGHLGPRPVRFVHLILRLGKRRQQGSSSTPGTSWCALLAWPMGTATLVILWLTILTTETWNCGFRERSGSNGIWVFKCVSYVHFLSSRKNFCTFLYFCKRSTFFKKDQHFFFCAQRKGRRVELYGWSVRININIVAFTIWSFILFYEDGCWSFIHHITFRAGKSSRVKDKWSMCQLSPFLGAFMTSYITLIFISHWPNLGHMATPSCIGVLLGRNKEELIQGRQLAVSVSCGLIHSLDFSFRQVLTWTECSCHSAPRCEAAYVYLFALSSHLVFCFLSSSGFHHRRLLPDWSGNLAIMWKHITSSKFVFPNLLFKTYMFCVLSLLGS